jgi:hypothetical protein
MWCFVRAAARASTARVNEFDELRGLTASRAREESKTLSA